MSKVCSKCKRTLHEREFPAQYTYCKACRNQDLKIKREALRVQQKYQVNLMKQWFCVPSEIVDFHKRNNLPLPKSYNVCKPCDVVLRDKPQPFPI